MSIGSTVALVMRTSLLRTRRRPSSWAIALTAVLPAALAALFGAVSHGALEAGTKLAIWLLGPLLAVALVSGSVGEQYENRTATYWMIRPIERASVPVGDWFGASVLLVVLLVVAGALAVAAAAIFEHDATANGPEAGRVLGALALEGLVLAGFATGIATIVPRYPLIAAVGVLTVTEGVVRNLPAGLANGSLTYSLERIAGLVGQDAPGGGDDAAGALMNAAMGPAQHATPLFVAFIVLAVYALVPMAIATQRVRDRDLA